MKGGLRLDTHGHGILLILIVVLSLYIIYLSKSFILPLITAAILSYVSYPLFKYLNKRLKSPKWCAFLSVLILALVVLIPLLVAFTSLGMEVVGIANSASSLDIPNLLEENRVRVNNAFNLNISSDQVDIVFQKSVSSFKSNLLNASLWLLNGVSSAFFQVFFILIFMFYLYLYGPIIYSKCVSVLPFSKNSKTKFCNEIRNDIKALFLGQGLVAIIQGVLGGIGFFIIGVPNIFLWTFIMIIASFLPIVGSWLVWFPLSIYLLITGEVFSGFFLLLWGVIIVSNIDNLLRPFIVNSMSKIDFLVVLVGVIIGIKAFNIIGIIVGPLLISILITLVSIYYDELSGSNKKRKTSIK